MVEEIKETEEAKKPDKIDDANLAAKRMEDAAAAMKVENDEVWSLVKDGALKGFSIEGWFTQAITNSK